MLCRLRNHFGLNIKDKFGGIANIVKYCWLVLYWGSILKNKLSRCRFELLNHVGRPGIDHYWNWCNLGQLLDCLLPAWNLLFPWNFLEYESRLLLNCCYERIRTFKALEFRFVNFRIHLFPDLELKNLLAEEHRQLQYCICSYREDFDQLS